MVRISLAAYNTQQEVDVLLAAGGTDQQEM